MEFDAEMLRQVNLRSDPVRLCFKESTNRNEAAKLYAKSWDCHISAVKEDVFSYKIEYFLRAFAYARRAIKTDPHYNCAKTAILLTGEILNELGVNIQDLPEDLEYAISLSGHPGPEACVILRDSWEFLQKLQSDKHSYAAFSCSDEKSLFGKVRNSVRQQEVGYSVDVQDGRRDFSEMKLDDLRLDVCLEGSVIQKPGYEDLHRVDMTVRGERIAQKLSGLLKNYSFKML